MNVIKRDGRIVEFDKSKVVSAIQRAFKEVDHTITSSAISISNKIADYIESLNTELTVEQIQDKVVNLLLDENKEVGIAYVQYRYNRQIVRESNTTDKTILEVVDNKNEYWSTENSNKNPMLTSTKRDYIAGTVSTDITRRMLLPEDIVAAHDAGEIHFHDADYFLTRGECNCCLVNLEDMLQNGTVISDVMIEKPHSFSTACNIAAQIVAQVASVQYGRNHYFLLPLRQVIKKFLLEKFF